MGLKEELGPELEIKEPDFHIRVINQAIRDLIGDDEAAQHIDYIKEELKDDPFAATNYTLGVLLGSYNIPPEAFWDAVLGVDIEVNEQNE